MEELDRFLRMLLWPVGVLLLLTVCSHAFGSISHKHQNSLGAVIDDSNPYIYLVAEPRQGAIFECDKGVWCTNILFQPYGTDLLHTESVTFCGNEGKSFLNGTQAIIYRRVAMKYYGGIGCHDLDKVLPIAAPGE